MWDDDDDDDDDYDDDGDDDDDDDDDDNDDDNGNESMRRKRIKWKTEKNCASLIIWVKGLSQVWQKSRKSRKKSHENINREKLLRPTIRQSYKHWLSSKQIFFHYCELNLAPPLPLAH